jgi:hypothetical protein
LCCTPDIVPTCRRQCRNGNATRFVTVTLTLIRWSHCTSWTPAAAVTNHVTSAAAGESGMLLPSPLLPALVLPPAGRLLPRTRSARSSNNALYTNRYWSGVCSAQHSTAQHSTVNSRRLLETLWHSRHHLDSRLGAASTQVCFDGWCCSPHVTA